jgi:hypothetical protein
VAFIEKLFEPPADDPEAALSCRFPARYLWLERKLALSQYGIRASTCPRFEKWRAQIDASSAELLFAAAFLNSPASMYGHTLLKLGRKGPTQGEAILDYVVAYGAETGDVGGLPYIVLGLSGGFPGYFSTMPFYLKIREYNDAESRDIWSYSLKLNERELDFLVRHLWEARQVRFPYYFLGKNCSYFLLRLLDIVHEKKSFTAELPIWTIPVDTIRQLDRRGRIGQREHRPSRSQRMFARRESLSSEEKSLAKAWARDKSPPPLDVLKEDRQAKVLDAAFEYHRYLQAGAPLLGEYQERELRIALARSRLSIPAAPLSGLRAEPPEESHLSNRAGVFFGERKPDQGKPSSFGLIEWRPAIQDLLSDPFGLDHYGEQEIMRTRLRISERGKKILAESFDLIRIRALSPIDSWVKKPSWRFALAADREKGRGCLGGRCTYFLLEVGGGMSAPIFGSNENILFCLMVLDTHAGAPFAPNYRIGAGPEFGIKLRPLGPWRILAEARWKRYFLGDKEWRKSLRVGQSLTLSKKLEVRAEAELVERDREYSAGVFRYF